MSEVREKSVGYRVQRGYKQTEVGVIPQDWRVENLDECVRNDAPICYGILMPGRFHDGGVPVIKVKDIKRGRVDESDILLTHPTIDNAYKRSRLRSGDLLITIRGTTGRLAIVPKTLDGANITQDTARVRLNGNHSREFLFFVLQSRAAQDQIAFHTIGQAVKGINIRDVKGIEVPLPPTLAEQTAIAEALGDADAWIESLEQLVAKKRHLKQAAMQQLLTGKKRLPGFEGEWKLTALGNVLTVRHGKSQKAIEVNGGQYPILATGGQIGTSNSFLHDQPSVLIGRKGTIDRPQYIDTPFWTVDTLFYCEVIAPNNAKFLYYRFCLIDWRSHNEASGVPSLNSGTIEKLEVGVPDAVEQLAIADVLSDMDAEITAVETKLTKARQIKQGMMQELLTGRIRLV